MKYHHQPINVPTARAQVFPVDGTGRLGHDPPRGPSADWWLREVGDWVQAGKKQRHFTASSIYATGLHIHLTSVQYMLTDQGKLLLTYKGHYYAKCSRRARIWRCINTSHCYVSVVLESKNTLKKEPRAHDHEPAIFYRTENGTFRRAKLTNQGRKLKPKIEMTIPSAAIHILSPTSNPTPSSIPNTTIADTGKFHDSTDENTKETKTADNK
ncbi:hypothetical protein evm_005201 [Chilo suppressalis]|nr:hypothetical protein evm_005201 [Chilo suppressalis]